MRADQEELAERIARATPSEGTVEVQPGLHFRRCSRPTERLHSFTKPSFCVIAQGSKELVVGDDHFRYDPAHYMISTVELPMIGQSSRRRLSGHTSASGLCWSHLSSRR